jgi:(E)-4-hydroxy-3-methylbut-2-enyl-diphosphate synthase
MDTRVLRVGKGERAVLLGGGYPPVVQTMWKERLEPADLAGERLAALLDRIEGLSRLGCGLLRFAVPDMEAAETLGELARLCAMPLAADIHFDYRLALRCLDFPIAKIRINPGNIVGRDRTIAVAEKAAKNGVPIRIGINAGSLPADIEGEVVSGRMGRAEGMVLAAEREMAVFREIAFEDYLVSVKSSSVAETLGANRLLVSRTDAPIHIGVTEAGPLVPGLVRNTAALFTLLSEGIGATLRVSLSDTPEREVLAGREIVAAVQDCRGQGRRGVTLISCPRCGRASFDTHGFTARWEQRLYGLDRDITVAVMGCVVNGPGESRHADIGVTGAGDQVIIFRRGEKVRTVNRADADEAFWEEIGRL